jgi:hypothetical protein
MKMPKLIDDLKKLPFKDLQAAADRRCRLLRKDTDGYELIEAHTDYAYRQWGVSRGGIGTIYDTLEDVLEELASLPIVPE